MFIVGVLGILERQVTIISDWFLKDKLTYKVRDALLVYLRPKRGIGWVDKLELFYLLCTGLFFGCLDMNQI